MRSKIIIYAVIAIAVIAAVFLAWHFLFSGSATVPPSSSAGQTGSLPSAGTQTGSGGANQGAGPSGAGAVATGVPSGSSSFGVISNEPVLAYYVDTENNVAIVEPDGKIAAIANGQPNFLSSTEIQGVLAASFSYDGKKVLVNFGNPSDPQTSVFDVTTKAGTPLPAGLVSPVWSRTDYRVAYLTNAADGTATLWTLDISRTSNKPAALMSMHAADLSVAWPTKNAILLSGKPSAYAASSAWLFDLTSKTLIQAVPDSFGMESVWSATTSTVGLVLSSENYGRNGGLSLVDPGATATQPLTLATLPSKCAFNYEYETPSSTAAPYLALYCAVPADASFATAILPDAYIQKAIFTSDNFYGINTGSGATTNTFSPRVSVAAERLRVINHILFFVNRYDLKLYAISLSAG